MSAEKKFSSEVTNLDPFVTPEKSKEVSSSGRVDINILLNRARKINELLIMGFIYLLGCSFWVMIIEIIYEPNFT